VTGGYFKGGDEKRSFFIDIALFFTFFGALYFSPDPEAVIKKKKKKKKEK
jgi:hypothetical protein